jgi:hypothetical protein
MTASQLAKAGVSPQSYGRGDAMTRFLNSRKWGCRMAKILINDFQAAAALSDVRHIPRVQRGEKYR